MTRQDELVDGLEELGDYFFPSSLPSNTNNSNLQQKNKKNRKNKKQKKDTMTVGSRRRYGYANRFTLPYRTLSHRPLSTRGGIYKGMGERGMSVSILQVMTMMTTMMMTMMMMMMMMMMTMMMMMMMMMMPVVVVVVVIIDSDDVLSFTIHSIM